jgi:hypothetical protein
MTTKTLVGTRYFGGAFFRAPLLLSLPAALIFRPACFAGADAN